MISPPPIPEDDAAFAKKKRTGGRSARVLEQVARAVTEELKAVGVTGFSVPRVAQRAGVHTATIYRRWPNANALMAFATGRMATQILPVPDTGSLEGDLLAMLQGVRSFLEGPDSAMLVALAFGAAEGAERDEVVRLYWQERMAGRQAMFARARARGEIGAQEDPEELVERAIGPLYVRRYISRRPMDDGFLHRVVAGVLRGR